MSGVPLNTCGCCPSTSTAVERFNRPGLDAIAYRAGVHGDFLRRLLTRLPSQEPLRALTTRSTDDPAIALLDAWSILADVFTFYQERIANEGYLRTALDRRSVLELARAIGYELNPGVSAEAFLTFIVETAPGAPLVAGVPVSTRVQSIPKQGQLPQTFETSAAFTARAEWNELRPRLTQPQPLDPEASTVFIDGIETSLEAGQLVLFVHPGASPVEMAVKIVTAVGPDNVSRRTRVDLQNPPKPPPPFVLPPVLNFAFVTTAITPFTQTSISSAILGQTWRENDLGAFVSIQGWNSAAMISHVSYRRPATPPPPPPPQPVDLPPVEYGLYAFDERVGIFGNSAPLWASLPENQRDSAISDAPYKNNWDNTTPPHILQDSQDNPITIGFDKLAFRLERTLDGLTVGSWILLDSGVGSQTPARIGALQNRSVADFSLSGKVTQVNPVKHDGAAFLEVNLDHLKFRTTTVHSLSRLLPLAALPIEDNFGLGTAEENQLTLDTMVLGLSVGQLIAISGERVDMPGVRATEIAEISEIVHSGGLTTLFFKNSLTHTHVRATATISANVVRATHGETIRETLGSGDGAQTHQRFEIKKPPLTYVSAATASGSESTMEVRVNGIEWAQSPRLFGLAPTDENYIVRIEDDGKTRVIFGDGERGARLPTGVENVTAVYRSGIGTPGMVSAGQLTLLSVRPFGMRGVTNPLDASGAAEPETRDQARTNAPLQVLTLDRIVSVQDAEDFSRAFAGIAKSKAQTVFRGESSIIVITVAGPDAADVPAASSTYINLNTAIASSADPSMAFLVRTRRLIYFKLDASLLIDSRYLFEDVRAAAEASLFDVFSFDKRSFAQAVTAAEVTTALQAIEGVIAVDLNKLHRSDDSTGPSQVTPPAILFAGSVTESAGDYLGAEILLLQPGGVVLTEKTS